MVVISNHGARQLDSVAPTIRVLPEILAAVDGKIDVLLDGGIRRGSDVEDQRNEGKLGFFSKIGFQLSGSRGNEDRDFYSLNLRLDNNT